ncbi:MAG: nitroreductase family protein [Candidatus Schekmanbacteria bacterium]|nr:nitroreductase family protein [Candidatus Schekmanbacteria bacterium]
MEAGLQAFYDILKRRKSIRQFSGKAIEEEKLARLWEVLRSSPSAANRQPWHFIVLPKKGREKFDQEVLTKDGFHSAPIIIVACAVPDEAWVRKEDGENYAWVDVSIAVTEFITAATAEGLGTCWVASFNLNQAKKLLKLPEEFEIVTLLAVGYPLTPLTVETKQRKELSNILSYHNMT